MRKVFWSTLVLFSLVLFASLFLAHQTSAQTSFRFASISDAHVETGNFTNTTSQIRGLNPNFILFNGDVENEGVANAQMDPMMNILGDMLSKTFIVRGNHDDHVSGSGSLWENYFIGKFGASRSLPSGATNYVAIDSNSTYLTYSFDYGNSRFIGLDSNQYGDAPTSAQLTFLDQRLTDAENSGLTHAFIFVHPPEYCVEDTHCSCQTATGCGPSSQFVNIINKHPIVSATIHGHEHIIAWVHMDSTRVPGLTHSYEEFFTSSAGNPYDFNPYPARMNYYKYSSSIPAFGVFDVSGSSFTASLYQTGNNSPVWSQTFTKGTNPTTNPTITASPTTKPSTQPTTQPTTNPGSTRPLKFYGVDRVRSNSDFATLASWGINTAIVAIPTNGSTSSWQSTYDAARNAGVNIVIWPLDPAGDNNCGWESPFNAPVNGNYIGKITAMLDWWANKPGVIGINTFHEPMWSTSAGCKDSIADLSAIYSQIHSYTNNPNFEVYGYINTLNTSAIKSGDGNGTGIADYTGPSDLAKIMDVAVIWLHCAGSTEGPCEGNNSAMTRITEARTALNSVNSKVKLIYLQQTFTMGSSSNPQPGDYSYSTKFTLNDLEKYSCDFLNTSALDGFAFYTWDEGWYSGNLKKWTDIQPAVPYIYNNCVNKSSSTPAPTSVPVATPRPGDANGDKVVDGVDYATYWLPNYGKTVTGGAAKGDFNSDGKVDGVDYVIWLNNYNGN